MTLEESLKMASIKVWNELEPIPINSVYKVFEVREEALTTMAIKELYKSKCPSIDKIEMIPGNEESLKGYDFEMAIGSKSKGKYVRLFIQAKRLYGKSINNSFDALDFSQTELLINYSKKESSLAMYAFYNHLLDSDLELINCYNSATPYDKKNLGITLASAYSVKKLQSKKFYDYHFNNERRIDPKLYSLRYYPQLFYFHKASRSHLAVPFHELSYFTIEIAEKINKVYRRLKRRGKTNFFFFFFPGIEDFLNGDKYIIPVLETNISQLVADFQKRTFVENEDVYQPKALIVFDTDNLDFSKMHE